MKKLVFDIETIGEDFETLDRTTRDVLTRWIKKDKVNSEGREGALGQSETETEYETALLDLKNRLGFSPLTGQIVAIGVYDIEKERGAVYFQDPENILKETEENGIKYKPMSEKDMLDRFWKLADIYDEFISFNGRSFDVPFMMIRSAVHKIKPTKNLVGKRYLSTHEKNERHIDLLDQLTFYGTVRKKGNLHLWSRVFGIKSPKSDGITGDDVGTLFKEKKFLEIAKYNAGDLYATRDLYYNWEKYLRM